MNYQSICAALEAPLNTAFGTLLPPVKIFFDNLIVVPPDAPGEYVRVNIGFGPTTESMLTQSLGHARGAIIIRIFTRKGNGAGRARQLAQVAFCTLRALGETKKPSTGTFVRVRDIAGPRFFMGEQEPHFMTRIEASWDATNLG